MTYQLPNNYYNRTDKLKNYKKLLFLSGQGLQSAELNEVQEFIRNDLESIGGYLVGNGSVISGGEISALSDTSITIKSASVYVDGHVVEVPDLSVVISGSGIEIIGVASKTILITDQNDPGLREPDPSSPNYNIGGSYREKVTGRWCLSTSLDSEESFFPIITLSDGLILAVSRQSDDPQLLYNRILAQYDNETRGSCLIRGMGITFRALDMAGSPIMPVASGRARVQGIGVTNPYERLVLLDPLADTRQTLGEPYVYSGSHNYTLRNTLVSSIVRVQGVKQVTRTITHGGFSGAVDNLPDTPVLAISSVSQGATTYVANTDYFLSGDAVSWSLPGAEPAPGSTYTVTYTYISTFVPAITGDSTGIVLDSSNVLVSGSTFYVDYNYYLRRIDRISINSSGQFVITRGTPGYTNYSAPSGDPNNLSLATVRLVKGLDPVVIPDTIYNVNLEQMNAIITRLQNAEYNIARLSLLDNANSYDPVTNKRGLFVDPLRDDSYRDAGITNNAVVNRQSLTLDSTIAVLGTTTGHKVLPFTEVTYIDQSLKSKFRKINPYASPTDSSIAQAIANPNIISVNSSWNNNNTSTLVADQTATLTLDFFGANETISVSYLSTTTTVVANSSGHATLTITIPAGTHQGSYVGTAVGQTSTNQAKFGFTVNIMVQIIPAPVVNNITNNTYVNNTTVNNTYYEYTDPTPPVTYVPDPPTTPYVDPTPPTTTPTIPTVQPPTTPVPIDVSTPDLGYQDFWWDWTPIMHLDPIAQTILITDDIDISSIEIDVVDLPSDDIIVKITDTGYGIPDSNKPRGTGRIRQSTIVEGWNKVTLEAPASVYADNYYAAVIITSKPDGSVSCAKVGDVDSETLTPITTQPDMGVLNISANLNSWTAIQDEDLTFKLNRAEYSTTSTVTLITVAEAGSKSDWLITGTVNVPDGTFVRFYLQDASGNQYDMALNSPLFTPALTGQVLLKATMSTANTKRSPKILQGLSLYGGTPIAPADYVTRQIPIKNGVSSPSNLTLILNVYALSGATIAPTIQKADNSFAAMTLSTTTDIGDNWKELVYTYANLASLNTRLKLTLDTSVKTVRPLVQKIRLLIV